MEKLTPRYISESESDNRSIKEGWYAVRRNGSVRFGPFLSREKCLLEMAAGEDEPMRGV